jgi:hypothetical protein
MHLASDAVFVGASVRESRLRVAQDKGLVLPDLPVIGLTEAIFLLLSRLDADECRNFGPLPYTRPRVLSSKRFQVGLRRHVRR